MEKSAKFQKSNNIKYNLFTKTNCQVEANIKIFEKNLVEADDVVVKMEDDSQSMEMSHQIYDGEQRPPS